MGIIKKKIRAIGNKGEKEIEAIFDTGMLESPIKITEAGRQIEKKIKIMPLMIEVNKCKTLISTIVRDDLTVDLLIGML